MTKLSIKANPTFDAEVGIPVAGGEPAPVRMTFKHRTKTELAEFVAARKDKSDVESFLEMVTGWDLTDAFNEASVRELLENYIGAALATYYTYIDELTKARAKN